MNEQTTPATIGEIAQPGILDEQAEVPSLLSEVRLSLERINSLKFDIFHMEELKAEIRIALKQLLDILRRFEIKISKLEIDHRK